MAVINQPIEFHSVDISLPSSLSLSRSTTLEGAKLTRIIGSTRGRERKKRGREREKYTVFVCWMGSMEARMRIIAPSNENSSRREIRDSLSCFLFFFFTTHSGVVACSDPWREVKFRRVCLIEAK